MESIPFNPTPAPAAPPPIDFSDLTKGLDPTPSLEASRTNIRIGSEITVRQKNAELKYGYLNVTWANYVLNMQSGQTLPEERRVPPKPPMAWELAPPDGNGYVFPMIGTKPVCDMPPLPTYAAGLSVNKQPGMIMIGHNAGGKWFTALPGDTFPSGQTTPPMTSTDGVTGTFQKFGAPVGYGWYLLVS